MFGIFNKLRRFEMLLVKLSHEFVQLLATPLDAIEFLFKLVGLECFVLVLELLDEAVVLRDMVLDYRQLLGLRLLLADLSL